MDNYDDQPYTLPAELNNEAQDIGWKLARSLDQLSGCYLVQRQETALTFQDGSRTIQMSSGDIARFLNQLRPMALDSVDTPKQDLRVKFGGATGSNILRFIELWLEELRGIICKGCKEAVGNDTYRHRCSFKLAGYKAWRTAAFSYGGRHGNSRRYPYCHERRFLQDDGGTGKSRTGRGCSSCKEGVVSM
jgi:hypothetical protein